MYWILFCLLLTVFKNPPIVQGSEDNIWKGT